MDRPEVDKSERHAWYVAVVLVGMLALLIALSGGLTNNKTELMEFAGKLTIAALVSLFITGLNMLSRSFFIWRAEKRIMKKYNISGAYFTEYQDNIDGEVAIVKERVTLKQKGSRVRWVSRFGNREWSFAGELEGDLVFGNYQPANPLDQGRGSFSLKIDNDNNLLGVWMGYDSTNRLVSQGMYYLKKVPSIVIADYDAGTMKSQVGFLLSQEVGSELVGHALGDGQGEGYHFTVAVACKAHKEQGEPTEPRSEEVLGVLLWKMETGDLMQSPVPALGEHIPPFLWKAGGFATVLAIAVHPNRQAEGIEKHLLQGALETIMQTTEASAVVGVQLSGARASKHSELDRIIRESRLLSRGSHMSGDADQRPGPHVEQTETDRQLTILGDDAQAVYEGCGFSLCATLAPDKLGGMEALVGARLTGKPSNMESPKLLVYCKPLR